MTVLIDGAPTKAAISQLHVGDMVMVRTPVQWLQCSLPRSDPRPQIMAEPYAYGGWACGQEQNTFASPVATVSCTCTSGCKMTLTNFKSDEHADRWQRLRCCAACRVMDSPPQCKQPQVAGSMVCPGRLWLWGLAWSEHQQAVTVVAGGPQQRRAGVLSGGQHPALRAPRHVPLQQPANQQCSGELPLFVALHPPQHGIVVRDGRFCLPAVCVRRSCVRCVAGRHICMTRLFARAADPLGRPLWIYCNQEGRTLR